VVVANLRHVFAARLDLPYWHWGPAFGPLGAGQSLHVGDLTVRRVVHNLLYTASCRWRVFEMPVLPDPRWYSPTRFHSD
jgi:hypothetical protein